MITTIINNTKKPTNFPLVSLIWSHFDETEKNVKYKENQRKTQTEQKGKTKNKQIIKENRKINKQMNWNENVNLREKGKFVWGKNEAVFTEKQNNSRKWRKNCTIFTTKLFFIQFSIWNLFQIFWIRSLEWCQFFWDFFRNLIKIVSVKIEIML